MPDQQRNRIRQSFKFKARIVQETGERKNFQGCVDYSPRVKNAVSGENSFLDQLMTYCQSHLIHSIEKAGISRVHLRYVGNLLACLLE